MAKECAECGELYNPDGSDSTEPLSFCSIECQSVWPGEFDYEQITD
jgi:hypothetical protein